ncbi:phosphoribosylformylglycinamidine synthase [Alkalispirochaeta sphaeroplastigenens]|uniref:Phosphoribosylformylglycinamidine synthase subunit PurL n=1 Tax=Alkalispirochaeta sphaeroplastigenens TaxID=1187066 RepID=A0A2S4JRA0_9SPIO|nr:phosphoribosylformylglycinamidine synthase subunit PurL [Alkalispirochaeta sphaeroplastigenens]POR02000.1 phosphoribosylformylglycinamidine synthase [Alkalispirochaeta sphaeroplastigenens]
MQFTRNVFDLQGRSDQEIEAFLEGSSIGLTLQEAKQLQFSILKRPPSVAEFVLFGIEGSEHCSYKSSREHLSQFITQGPEVVLGAKEDAGVIRVARDRQGRGYCVVMSHESHNHPSQIVPYEGAATGVGGNVRDICCMGGEVVALADDLRFGAIESPRTRWIYDGVVSGIAGYGNPIGVPSLAGGLQFDRGYQDNCLVTVVSLGILREDHLLHSYAPPGADGYDLILVGKPTDSSGFGGASFASFDLDAEQHEQNKGAVQEPNAFLGRHLLQAAGALSEKLAERGAHHRVGFKDLGAGGIACASVEIADTGGYGAEVMIDQVHRDAPGLPAHVVLCSETQERYMYASPPDLTPLILEHYNQDFALPQVSRGAEARVIGKITDSPRFRVIAGGEVIVDAPACEVTRGFLYNRPFVDPPLEESPFPPGTLPAFPGGQPGGLEETLLALLGHENIASRKCLYDRYDKQVQGRVMVEAGLSDSGILAPFNSGEYPEEIRQVGLTLTTDQNPRMNRRDPHLGAVLAVVESYTNTVASGARPVAISDCLCYGNPEKPQQMGLFVAGCRGVAEACRELSIPVIAGNVSLYNESLSGSIPPSPMIACLGQLEDYRDALTQNFLRADSPIYLLLEREGRWGGSVFEELLAEGDALPGEFSRGSLAGPLPRVDYGKIRAAGELILEASRAALVRACHDISEGGLGVALCEMTFGRSLGCAVSLPVPGDPGAFLFEESPGFVLEIDPAGEEAFCALARKKGVEPVLLGRTIGEPRIIVEGVWDMTIERARTRWEQGLMEKLL